MSHDDWDLVFFVTYDYNQAANDLLGSGEFQQDLMTFSLWELSVYVIQCTLNSRKYILYLPFCKIITHWHQLQGDMVFGPQVLCVHCGS